MPRGKSRVEFYELPLPLESPKIPAITAQRLRAVHSKLERPLLDKVTEALDVNNIGAYLRKIESNVGRSAVMNMTGGMPIKGIKEVKLLLSERNRLQNNAAQSVINRLERQIWLSKIIAEYRKAAIEQVWVAEMKNEKPNPTAARHAADAAIDFAHCLKDKPLLREIPFEGDLPTSIAFVGEAAINNSEAIINNPGLFEVISNEQSRRMDHWGDKLSDYQRRYGNRLTDPDNLDQINFEACVQELYPPAA